MTDPIHGEAPLDPPPGDTPLSSRPGEGPLDSRPGEGPLDRLPGGAASPLPPHAEPVVTGTVFIMLVFLMALAGLWGIMYLLLLGR